MGTITKTQAVVRLKGMLSRYKTNEQQYRDIEREIKSLQGGADANLEFNLPKLFNLPTLYETKRLDQTASSAALPGSTGGIGYQDNSIRSVQVYVQGGDPQEVVQVINDAFAVNRNSPVLAQY